MNIPSFVCRSFALTLLAASPAVAVSHAAAAAAPAAASAKQIWTQKLPGDAKWHQLTGLGTLLVGTDGALLSFNPEDGTLLWRRDDIAKTNIHNAREIAGTPILICNNLAGIGNSKVTFQALDYLEGKTLWTAPQITGQYLDTIPVPSKNLVIFVVNTTEGSESGIFLFAHDLSTGERKWATKFAKGNAIPLHLADNSGRFMPTMDLSGYHEPVIDGDEMYLGYLGVHCVDLVAGKVKWGIEFPPGNKGLKKTYAPLRIVGDRIYGAGGGSVYAIDRRSGQQLWKSERISEYAGLLKARNNAIVSQLEIVGDKIFARFGGNFSNGQAVQLAEPLGVVVLSAADGKDLFQAKGIEAGLTNLMVLPETNTVMFADGKDLVGLDSAAAVPTETFRVPIEFKRKMGGGDVAKIGLGLTGGLMGVAKATMSSSKSRLDVPVAIVRQSGHIVVQGKQHLLGFDPQAKSEKWSLFYGAPSDAFATIAMFAVTAAASLQGNAQVAQNGSILTSGGQEGMQNIQSALDRYNRYTEKRAGQMAQASSTAAYTYILTKVGKGDIGLYGVNLTTGETDRELALGSKEPDYMADESTGRIFYFKGKDSVVAYQF